MVATPSADGVSREEVGHERQHTHTMLRGRPVRVGERVDSGFAKQPRGHERRPLGQRRPAGTTLLPAGVMAGIQPALPLRTFVVQNGLERGLCLSLDGYREQGWVVNVPLCLTCRLSDGIPAIIQP